MDGFVGIEKLSLVDYDDMITCTLFTETCNFRCPFCHNASLVLGHDNQEISFSDIINFLKSRVGKLDAVCITGGEPTLLPSLEYYLTEIKKLGFKVKLDTNGTNPVLIKKLINKKLIDYIAMDIKNQPLKYSMTIGKESYDLSKINESIKILMIGIIPYEFRTTLVSEFHTLEDMKLIGEWIKGSRRYVLQHFMDQGNCIKNNLHEVNKEEVLKMQKILLKYIPNTELRGY